MVLLGAPPSFGSTLRGSSTEEQRHLLSSSSSSKQEGDHAHIRRTEARPILQNQRRNVVGGQPATESEAPFYVALIALVGNTYQFQKCGGSLLSSRHVMTAAHCLEVRCRETASSIAACCHVLLCLSHTQFGLVWPFVVFPIL